MAAAGLAAAAAATGAGAGSRLALHRAATPSPGRAARARVCACESAAAHALKYSRELTTLGRGRSAPLRPATHHADAWKDYCTTVQKKLSQRVHSIWRWGRAYELKHEKHPDSFFGGVGIGCGNGLICGSPEGRWAAGCFSVEYRSASTEKRFFSSELRGVPSVYSIRMARSKSASLRWPDECTCVCPHARRVWSCTARAGVARSAPSAACRVLHAVCADCRRPYADYASTTHHMGHGVRTHARTTPTQRGDLLFVYHGAHQHVFGLQVAVNVPELVHVLDRKQDLHAVQADRSLSSLSTPAPAYGAVLLVRASPCTTSRHCAAGATGTASSARIRRRACDVHECGQSSLSWYRGTAPYRRKRTNTCEHITSAP